MVITFSYSYPTLSDLEDNKCLGDLGLVIPLFNPLLSPLQEVDLLLSPLQEEELVSSENSASIFNTLSDLPSQLGDGAAVLGEAMRLAGALSQDTLETQRNKHLAYILNEQAQLNTNNSHTLNNNLNKVSGLIVTVCVCVCVMACLTRVCL